MTSDPLDAKTRRQIEAWRTQLVDLSRRNPLISFSTGNATRVEVVAPELPKLFMPEGKPKEIWLPPDLPDAKPRKLELPHRSEKAGARQIRCAEADPYRLHRNLETLARHARSDLEDKGLRTLFLAIGLLNWKDAKSSAPLTSPLILAPVSLVRKSPRHLYELRFVDDETTVVNPALTLKLQQENKLDLPEEWAWENKPLEEELDEIELSLSSPEFVVERRAFLARFSFQKLVMYRDLLENEDAIAEHSLVRTFAVGAVPREAHEQVAGVASADELDERDDPRENFAVLDADASQRRCLDAARTGVSFVIQGPPGTGKSQTIANIIADAIARGQSVLFVSEKLAALDVVHQRLSSVGLDRFALRLHGDHGGRREVVEALNFSLEERGPNAVRMPERELVQLAALRNTMNAGVEALHEARPELLGRTAFEVHGLLASLGTGALHIGARDAGYSHASDSPDDLAELLRIAKSMSDCWTVWGTPSMAWRGVAWRSDPSPAVLIDRAAQLGERSERLVGLSAQMALSLGFEAPETTSEIFELVETVEALRAGPTVPLAWQAPGAVDHVRKVARQAQDAHRDRAELRSARARLVPRRPDDADDAALASAWNEAGAAVHASHQLDVESLQVSELREFRDAATGLAEAIAQVRDSCNPMVSRIGLPGVPNNLEEFVLLTSLCEVVVRASQAPDLGWLSPIGLDRADDALQEFAAPLGEANAATEAAMTEWRREALDANLDDVIERFRAVHTSVLARLRSGYRADVRVLRDLRRSGKLPRDCAATIDVLDQARKLRKAATDWNDAGRLGVWFDGMDTDLAAALNAYRTAARIVELLPPGVDPAPVHAACQDDGRDLARIHGLAADRVNQLSGRVTQISGLVTNGRTRDLEALQAEAAGLLVHVEALIGVFETLEEWALTPPTTGGEVVEILSLLLRAGNAEGVVAEEKAMWTEVLQSSYEGDASRWDALDAHLSWIDDSPTPLHELPAATQALLATQSADWPDTGALAAAANSAVQARDELCATFEDGREPAALATLSMAAWHEAASDLAACTDDLGSWLDAERLNDRAVRLGWSNLLSDLAAQRVDHDDLPRVIERSVWRSRLEVARDLAPELRSLDRSTMSDRRAELVHLDREMIRSARGRVSRAVERRIPADSRENAAARRRITKEAAKQKRFIPIRRLLEETWHLTIRLRPCLMMSPLSVSHYLGPGQTFDLVVFDEASQVPPEDAINAIYRGGTVGSGG